MLLNLDEKLEAIILNLENLKVAPSSLVDPSRTKISLIWNNPKSLAKYAAECLFQYRQNKPDAKLHREFLTCIIAINYSRTIERLRQMCLEDDEMLTAKKQRLRVRSTVSTSCHDRLTRIGNRCFRVPQIFRGISGLAILGVYSLKRIGTFSVSNFNLFAAHLEREVEVNGLAVHEIMDTEVDKRLYSYYGAFFPGDIVPLLTRQ